MALERYREIVPDWDRFLEAAGRPEPTVLRVRTGRIAPGDLRERLSRKGFGLEPVAGMADFFRVTAEPHPVSKTLEHWLGLFYIQQAVTGLAAAALDPRPGERVLDLCAAPGGKTAHLAERMKDRGVLVAADADDKRLRALLGNVYRLGHPNVLAMQGDGRTFPEGALFDRVLVDAPCSAEGNLRQRGGELRAQDESFREYVTSLQAALLRRAVELVRPGGRVLYCTCTFAPEENEAVVDAVLGDAPATLDPIELDVPRAPGLTRFGGRRFDRRLERARRLYPHHLDSGGLFLALLRRTDGEGSRDDDGGERRRDDGAPSGEPRDRSEDRGAGEAEGSREGRPVGPRSPARGWSPVPAVFPGDGTPAGEARVRIEAGARGLRRAFGVPDRVLDSFEWIVRGNSVWAHRCPVWPIPAWEEDGWRVLSLGLRALKRDPRTSMGERPTSDLLRRLNGAVRRSVVELDRGTLLSVLDRDPLETPEVEDGFVGLRHGGRILGRGWVKEGVLRNEISKTRSKGLIRFLEAGEPQPATS